MLIVCLFELISYLIPLSILQAGKLHTTFVLFDR